MSNNGDGMKAPGTEQDTEQQCQPTEVTNSSITTKDASASEKIKGPSDDSKAQADEDDGKFDNTKEVLDDIENLLNDEEFIQSLNVVDAWEGEDESKTKKEHNRDEHRNSKDYKHREQRGSHNKDKSKKEDKKHEMTRRDPSKSSKDIERDKIRAKRDTESKILAEKEKAIKKILDSDTVVPPGTEAEALETIAEKHSLDNESHQKKSKERHRSFERQKVSPTSRRRLRPSPHRRRSPSLTIVERRRSPFGTNLIKYKSPFTVSPDRSKKSLQRSPVHRRSSPFGSERRKRISIDYRFSPEGRRSLERYRRRLEIRERELKFSSRRSRSTERRRSRSTERRRRCSRSPIDRRTGKYRSRSRTRSPDRRARKRSPFINEIARQFSKEALMPNNSEVTQPPGGTAPQMLNAPSPRILPTPGSSFMPGAPAHAIISGGAPYFGQPSVQQINYDPVPGLPMPEVEFSAGPVMYNQPNSGGMMTMMQHPGMMPAPVPSPKPVPPPCYNLAPGMPRPSLQLIMEPHNRQLTLAYPEYKLSSRNIRDTPLLEERLKTPEPPVISDSKLFEKTSLSSLLEASVSAKDSTGPPVLYPGFRQEILQHCEHALQNLPAEDPRLKMKGRFFFDPMKKLMKSESHERASNSVLLLKGVNKMYWDEEEQMPPKVKVVVSMHQKICQTDEVETDSKQVQTSMEMVSQSTQVYPHDLQKEEKRPIADRLDWSMRDTYDYAPKRRDADLRDSLSNSQRRVPMWNVPASPPRGSSYEARPVPPVAMHPMDYRPREYDEPSSFRGPTVPLDGPPRHHFERPNYPPGCTPAIDDFRNERNMHEQIPVILVNEDLDANGLRRDVDWDARGNALGGKLGSLYKLRAARGGRNFPPGNTTYRGTPY